MVFTAGQKLTASALNAAVCTPWTTYTPTWTAVSVNPVVGNGAIAGAWTKRGPSVLVRINLLMGSTTTFGTGDYRFSLPFTAATQSGFSTLPIWVGAATGFDAGTAYRTGMVIVASAATYAQVISNGGSGAWNPTTPHTWANGDQLALEFEYEFA